MLPVSSKPCNQFCIKMSASTFSRRIEKWYLVSTWEPKLKTDSLTTYIYIYIYIYNIIYIYI